MEEVLATIDKRRSVRHFKDDPIPKEVLDKIVDAGLKAPSAVNQQTPKIYVCQNTTLLRSLGSELEAIVCKSYPGILGRKEQYNLSEALFYDAPVVLFISALPNLPVPVFKEADCGLCAENILLAARSMGIGSVIVGLTRMFEPQMTKEKIGIPEEEEFIFAIALGYIHPDYKPVEKKMKEGRVVHVE